MESLLRLEWARRDQAGPGDEPGTNSHWLLGGEAGEAAEAVEAGDASLGYSSEIWVAGWFQARFQMRLAVDDALSSSFRVSSFWGVCVALLQEGGLLCRGSWEGWGLGQGSS